MKKGWNIFQKILLGILVVLIIGIAFAYLNMRNNTNRHMAMLGKEAPQLQMNGITFRDLNKNGALDIYENPKAPINDRVDDLVRQMNLEEKAGAMFITMIGTSPEGKPLEMPIFSLKPIDLMMSFALPTNSEMIAKKKMNSFNIVASLEAGKMANYTNEIQKMAERTRLVVFR